MEERDDVYKERLLGCREVGKTWCCVLIRDDYLLSNFNKVVSYASFA